MMLSANYWETLSPFKKVLMLRIWRNQSTYPIAEHVVAQVAAGFKPDALLRIFIGYEKTVVFGCTLKTIQNRGQCKHSYGEKLIITLWMFTYVDQGWLRLSCRGWGGRRRRRPCSDQTASSWPRPFRRCWSWARGTPWLRSGDPSSGSFSYSPFILAKK